MSFLGVDGPTWFLIYSGIGALLGAVITPFVYGAKQRKPATGFFVGVLVGAIGSVIWLVPLWLLVRPRPRSKTDMFDVTVAYNLGAAAAMGGRREEARYYFVQVTQADPRNLSAWLYLANLATTPLEAWSFLQQARTIDPGNPAVQEAVAVVWPQVRHLYGDSPEPPQFARQTK